MTALPLFIKATYLLAILGAYLIFLLTMLYLIGKHEKGLIYFLWFLVIIFLPVIGPIAYLLKHFSKTNSSADPALD